MPSPRQQVSKADTKKVALETKPAPPESRHQVLVNHLKMQIIKNANDYDKLYFKKYGVKKYLLRNKDGEPVEVWIYDKKSKPYPVLEDLAKKRLESLIAAAKQIFGNRQTEKDEALLKALETNFTEKLNELLKNREIKNKSDFKKLKKEIKELIQKALNDLGYIWQINHPYRSFGLTKAHYRAFYKELWKEAEAVTADYKKNNILTLNMKDRTVEYIERGTRFKGGERQSAKLYPSSHKRDEPIISNFGVTSRGIIAIEKNTDGEEGPLPLYKLKLKLNKRNFRHSAPVPIDYYKQEKRDKKNKVAIRADCVTITKQNIFNLEQEMLGQPPPSAEAKPLKTTMILVGLLTEESTDNQNKICYDMRLAAELARLEHPHLNLINFNFGVNRRAVGVYGHFYKYPPEQDFENKRSFAHLAMKLEKSLELALKESQDKVQANDNESLKIIKEKIKALFTNYKILNNKLFNFQATIEIKIKSKAEAYQQALNKLSDRSGQNENQIKTLKKELKKAEEELIQVKKDCRKDMDAFFNDYVQKYQLLQNEINTLTATLENNRNRAGLDPSLQDAIDALVDFKEILHLYCEDHWREGEHNGALQTRLINLGASLGNLDAAYSQGTEVTAASDYCKSGNDRTGLVEIQESVHCAEQALGKGAIDPQTTAISAASTHQTLTDTGAGTKSARPGDPEGPVNKPHAKTLTATSSLATHKLAKKKVEYTHNETQLIKPTTETSQLSDLLLQGFVEEEKQDPQKKKTSSKLTALDEQLKKLHENLQKSAKEKKVDTIDDFKNAIHVNKFSLKLFRIHEPSNSTKDVIQAYEACDKVPKGADPRALEKIFALRNLNKALNRWFIKHPLKTQLNSKGECRSDSRLPGMLALQEQAGKWLKQEREELNEKLNTTYHAGILPKTH